MLSHAHMGFEGGVPGGRSLAQAVEELSDRAEAVLARGPLIDALLPETSDLDLLAVGDADDLLPERLPLGTASPPLRRIDLIWLPREKLADVEGLAKLGLVGHRLLGSDVIYDSTGYVTRQRLAIGEAFYEPQTQAQRIEGFLDMGFLTVQEIGVTWDFPALALFWIHMAHTACLAAMLDGARAFCPNVYTRPFDHLQRAEAETRLQLEQPLIEALRLDVDPQPLARRLRRIHRLVSGRFPEPTWPASMRQLTRHEYRYFGSRSELDWRIGVAEEMSRQGLRPAAVFYLRFWAYALARLPMVHQRAVEGVDVSFVRPSRAVRPDLERLCPEILDDLSAILGGGSQPGARQVRESLQRLDDLRRQTLAFLHARNLEFPELKEWRPYEAPPRAEATPVQGQTG